MSRHTEMDKDAAARIQSAAAREPDSFSARSGFDARARPAADRRQDEQDHDEDEGAPPAGR